MKRCSAWQSFHLAITIATIAGSFGRPTFEVYRLVPGSQ
jgi:hypothetical protein